MQGWSEGAGLGRSKRGIKKHISVAHRIDNRGVGSKLAGLDLLDMESYITVAEGCLMFLCRKVDAGIKS